MAVTGYCVCSYCAMFPWQPRRVSLVSPLSLSHTHKHTHTHILVHTFMPDSLQPARSDQRMTHFHNLLPKVFKPPASRTFSIHPSCFSPPLCLTFTSTAQHRQHVNNCWLSFCNATPPQKKCVSVHACVLQQQVWWLLSGEFLYVASAIESSPTQKVSVHSNYKIITVRRKSQVCCLHN